MQTDRSSADKIGRKSASAYDLGVPPPLQVGTLYPVYVRGRAYLKAGQAQQARAEFQTMIDYRFITKRFAYMRYPRRFQ
jgi:hypothetical protein